MEGLRVWNIFWTPPWQKNLEQFLLIQQFWLMGTTSIPQPVITTAQFPISASHAGMPRKSSLWSPIFRHFSGPSPAWFSKACRRTCRKEIARSLTHSLQDRWPERCHQSIDPPCTTTPKSFRTRIVGKGFKVNIPGTEDPFVCFVPFPAPGLTDSLCSLGWQRPGNRPFPFPRMSLESPEDVCHVGEVPWDSLKLQLPLSKHWINAKQFVADYSNYLNINFLEQYQFCVQKWQCYKKISWFVAFTSVLCWTAWPGQNLFRMLTATIQVYFSCQS